MAHPNGEAEATHTAEQKIKASLDDNGILVSSSEGIESLSMRGYGVFEGKKLTLAFYEALFLLSKGIIQIEDNKMIGVNFKGLLQRFESVDQNAWVRYLIYRDLRSRGYVVREGFG
ncbi:hypothetical protein KAI31_01955, partial [Candidatus Bathyarchaeota archaeon]|nr:hypothetical protein [Candidatus Bathyarchaeota archaeon]